MTYDVAIIGGGPAGVAGGVYASRKKLKTIFVTDEWGGQSKVSPDIQNWIGVPSITGEKLAEALKTHLETYAGDVVHIVTDECVDKVEKRGDGFLVSTNKGSSYETKTVLITAGAHRRRLDVAGAEEFDQKGLTYCATCDGPLFADQDVVVVGGGNAAFETAAQLLAYTKSVTLLNRSDSFKADPVTVDKVLQNPKMKAMKNVTTLEVKGDKLVTGLVYKDEKSGETRTLSVTGVFVEIGLVPSTEFVAGLVDLDDYKRVKTDCRTQQTSLPGIWAAGDCTDELYHQNNIAAGDAVKAIEDIYIHLHTK